MIQSLADVLAELDVDQPCVGGCGITVRGPIHCEKCYSRRALYQHKDTTAELLARIPATFRWSTFAAPELSQRCGHHTAIRMLSEIWYQHNWIVLRGDTGTGKTSLAAAIAQDAIARLRADSRRALGLRWFSAHHLSSIRHDHGAGRGSPPELDMAMNASLLVLDELGSERWPEVCAEVLFHRHQSRNEHSTTIITTWASDYLLGDKYGGGVLRRLREGIVVELGRKAA